jgi:hypothetical protein
MPTTVPIDIGPPMALPITVVSGASGRDLTTIASVYLLVDRGDGKVVKWPATIASATAQTLQAVHAFVPGDLPVVGRYSVSPRMVPAAGQEIVCSEDDLIVTDPFGHTRP